MSDTLGRRCILLAAVTGAFLTALTRAARSAPLRSYDVAPDHRLNVRGGPGTSSSRTRT